MHLEKLLAYNVIHFKGNTFDWTRNDCDVGFLYDMYYACAIKDVERKRKHKSRREVDKGDKSIKNTSGIMDQLKASNGENNIEMDEKNVKTIRKTAETLIKHDTATALADLQNSRKEVEKGAEKVDDTINENKKGKEINEKKWQHHERKNKITRGKHKSGKNENVPTKQTENHNKEAIINNAISEITPTQKGGLKVTTRRMSSLAGHRLNVISSKYQEIETLLKDLRKLVESEEERVAERLEISNKVHANRSTNVIANKSGVHRNSHSINNRVEQEYSNNQKNEKYKTNKDLKGGDVSKNAKSKKESSASEKGKNCEGRTKQSKNDEINADLEGEDRRDFDAAKGDTKKKQKPFFEKCKLVAYLYFIAVRGLAEKYYTTKSPSWCKNGCIKVKGIPNIKKHRRPRSST